MIRSSILVATMIAGPAPARGTRGGHETPKTCDVGLYLISLHDLDPSRGTFGADSTQRRLLVVH